LENEGTLTITNGGFELAASASKYLDASHPEYHLHDKKGNKKQFIHILLTMSCKGSDVSIH